MSQTRPKDTKPKPSEVRMLISKDFSKSNINNNDVSKMKVFYKLEEPSEKQYSGRQEEGVIAPDKELKIQKSRLIVTEDDPIP